MISYNYNYDVNYFWLPSSISRHTQEYRQWIGYSHFIIDHKPKTLTYIMRNNKIVAIYLHVQEQFASNVIYMYKLYICINMYELYI